MHATSFQDSSEMRSQTWQKYKLPLPAAPTAKITHPGPTCVNDAIKCSPSTVRHQSLQGYRFSIEPPRADELKWTVRILRLPGPPFLTSRQKAPSHGSRRETLPHRWISFTVHRPPSPDFTTVHGDERARNSPLPANLHALVQGSSRVPRPAVMRGGPSRDTTQESRGTCSLPRTTGIFQKDPTASLRGNPLGKFMIRSVGISVRRKILRS